MLILGRFHMYFFLFGGFGPWGGLIFRGSRPIGHFFQRGLGVGGKSFLGRFCVTPVGLFFGSECFLGVAERSNWHYEIAFLVKVRLGLAV